jgi:hypothetical protein
MNNAIVMLCMLKDHYVIGACINAFVNKSLLKTNNVNDIDLVVMCDDYIYNKYKNTLKKYFDKVVKIDLAQYEMHDTDERKSENWFKKYSWVIYSLSKWQVLKLVEYKKVLFLDIDILPVSEKFYDVFNFDTPAFNLDQVNKKFTKDTCINNDRMYDLIDDAKTYDEYIENAKTSYYSLDGGIVLLRPNISEYNDYMNFVSDINKNGIRQMLKSGIDETTLFYFYSKQKKEKEFYRICRNFSDIPWEENNNKPNKDKIIYSYNFLSFIKPWKKSKIISWNEEYIWRDIYHKMIKTKKLRKLYEKSMKDGMEEFHSYDSDFHQQKRYYNVSLKKRNQELFKSNNLDSYEKIFNAEKKFGLDKKSKDYGYLNPKIIKKLFVSIKKYKIQYKKNKV